MKQIIQTPSGKYNRSQIPRLKVKFGDSPHNLQNLRDTRRAEQGRADNGLCRKIAAHYIFGAGDTNISRITIHPKRWNVLCKDKHQKKSSKNTENMVKTELLLPKAFSKIILEENAKPNKMLAFIVKLRVIITKKRS